MNAKIGINVRNDGPLDYAGLILYPLENPARYEKPRAVCFGIVARKIKEFDQ